MGVPSTITLVGYRPLRSPPPTRIPQGMRTLSDPCRIDLCLWVVVPAALALALGACSGVDARLPGGAHALPDGDRYWDTHGFFPLEPPIRLPLDAERRFETRVYVVLPPNARIGWEDNATGGGMVFPSGTIADRVDWWSGLVADVRGTEIGDRGRELFRVYRPTRAGSHDLFGYHFVRGDPAELMAVRNGFSDAMVRGMGFLNHASGPISAGRKEAIARFSRQLDCVSCHAHDRQALAPTDTRELPRRGTDGSGFYVPESVFSNRAPLETYRPIDPNGGDPFVHYECGDGRAVRGVRGTTAVRCSDGSIPDLALDLAAALAAGEPHAKLVCESRSFLASRFAQEARTHFQGAIAECASALDD